MPAAKRPAPKIIIAAAAENGRRRNGSERWHLAKEIPVALILAVLAQTAGGIWWMAQLSGKIDNLISAQTEFRAERYTQNDARRDNLILDQRFSAAALADRDSERRMNAIEARQDRIDARLLK